MNSGGMVFIGVLISFIFLISFSQWFYYLFKGIDTVVLNDFFYLYRVISGVIISVMIFILMTYVIAVVSECPSTKPEDRGGLLKKLDCSVYWKSKGFIERREPLLVEKETLEKLNSSYE